MRKIVLSTLAALTICTVSASASDVTLYQDENGQVFTTAGEGRTALEAPKHKETPWYSHADKLKFSTLTYIGVTHNDYKDGQVKDTDGLPKVDGITGLPVMHKHDKTNFEIRRGYFQVKAYLMDDPKSYYRITFDVHQNSDDDLVVRTKYAYIYLNEILPFTGVELGLVHRPWHDYEEHNAWIYRDISKVFTEDKNSAHLSNSADFGVNFKTKTKYFDSEIGVFNGEGYHKDFQSNDDSSSTALSAEWRATAHLLGVNGKDKQTTKTYFDVSFFGQYNKKHIKSNDTAFLGLSPKYDDLVFGGLHTVFNMPSFLLSAQYIKSEDTSDNSMYVSAQAGDGFSVNGEYRFGNEKQFRAMARYDTWTDKKLKSVEERADSSYLVGGAWQQNKNLQWVANVIVTDNEAGSDRQKYNGTSYMITAQVEF